MRNQTLGRPLLAALAVLLIGCEPVLPSTPIPVTAATTGDTPWERLYGGSHDLIVNDVLLTEEGDYLLVGTYNLGHGDVLLLRTDANGELLWQQTYGEDQDDGGSSVAQMLDGGLMIAGQTVSSDAQGTDALLIRTDQNGNELWSRTYGGPLNEHAAAYPMPDGGFMLYGNVVDPDDVVVYNPGTAGYGGFAGRSSIHLIRTDGQGNELWSRAYDRQQNVLASAGRPTPDGGFVVLATILLFPEPDDDILLLKVDQNGDEVWSHTWEEGAASGYALVQTSDGNYLMAGPYRPPGAERDTPSDMQLIKVDPNGNEIGRSTYGDPESFDHCTGVAETADGGYVALVERASDLYTQEADIVLIGVDEQGQFLWEHSRPGMHTVLRTVFEHPEGGFVVAGSTLDASQFKILLIRTRADGALVE